MARYRCPNCGYIYDEAKGDADDGIAPGTRWTDLPADWCCPVCGTLKEDFEPLDEDLPGGKSGDAQR